MYTWKLNDNQFTLLDRLKICKFFLNYNNFWTQNVKVQEFEEKMANFVGSKYAVFTSSGSTSNTILAMFLRDRLIDKVRNTIIFPSTTWTTSISPFIREGFIPKFIDINLYNLSMDLNRLEDYLKQNHEKVTCVFITSLLGFTIDIKRLKKIEKEYNVKIMLDNCEANLSYDSNDDNLSKNFTSTTSTYTGHCVNSVEGGFIFTNSDEEYEYFLLARNHGMTRSLDNYFTKTNKHNFYNNPIVDHRFDFNILGNNYRNTDIHAKIGLLDFERINEYKKSRIKLYQFYYDNLRKDKYLLPKPDKGTVAFSLPIIIFNNDKRRYNTAKSMCEFLKIESRPIISGFVGFHSAYKKYFGNYTNKEFENSIYLHNFGFYIGLHNKVKQNQILDLVKELNKI